MLIKIWFSLISAILVVSLGTLLYSFNFINILHWIALIALVYASGLSLLIYLERPHIKDMKEMQDMYGYYLKKKDQQIDELQKRNQLMLNTAMKNAERDLKKNGKN